MKQCSKVPRRINFLQRGTLLHKFVLQRGALLQLSPCCSTLVILFVSFARDGFCCYNKMEERISKRNCTMKGGYL